MTKNRGVMKNSSRIGEIIAWLRISEASMIPRPIYNNRAKSTEKDKGVDMIIKIKEIFNLSDNDVKEMTEKVLIDEAYEQRNIQKPNVPYKWTRDDKGNIVSPWSVKAVKSKRV